MKHIILTYSFQLNKHYLLVEMSIAAGNDFTGPFMHGRLHHRLDVRGRKCIQNFAGWIRHYKTVDNNQVLYEEMVMQSILVGSNSVKTIINTVCIFCVNFTQMSNDLCICTMYITFEFMQ